MFDLYKKYKGRTVGKYSGRGNDWRKRARRFRRFKKKVNMTGESKYTDWPTPSPNLITSATTGALITLTPWEVYT